MNHATPLPAAGAAPPVRVPLPFDGVLLVSALALLGLGLTMIASASIGVADSQTGEPFHYLLRQGAYALVGLGMAWLAAKLPLSLWRPAGPVLLLASMVLLVVLFVPGLGREVNGSTRWLLMGPLNLQVSEVAKLVLVIYLAGYLVRHAETVCTTIGGFLRPLLPLAILVGLCAAQPDFGAAAVLAATALGMLFLGGVRLWLFGVLAALVVAGMGLLAVSAEYRMKRLTAFMDPWADPFDTGFQLIQALIAFGRGEWLGVGLGAGVQKLFYLPEAHTDFLFAILGEELGLLGVTGVIGLFGLLIWRIFAVGRRALRAGDGFGAHLAFGIGLWLGMQAVINMGVNMGLLPTKGLTLPLMSYGGSSMLVTCVALALVLRVDYETNTAPRPAPPAGSKRRQEKAS